MSAAAIHGCSLVLAHAPDLVRHGSKPTREGVRSGRVAPHLRGGARLPAAPGLHRQSPPGRPLADRAAVVAQPGRAARGGALRNRDPAERALPSDGRGRRLPALQARRLELRAADLRRRHVPRLDDGGARRGREPDRARCCSRTSPAKRPARLPSNTCSPRRPSPQTSVEYAIGCGEEAVGDRYQRGGGNLAKAIAEQAGCRNASGSDVKAFCCAPLHALVTAASLVAAGVFPYVAVVAGGSLAKLGMKFGGAVKNGVPVLEDVLAGLAILVGPPGDGAPGAAPRRRRPAPRRLRARRSRLSSRTSSSGRSSRSAGAFSMSTAMRPSSTTRRSPSRPARATSRAATTA